MTSPLAPRCLRLRSSIAFSAIASVAICLFGLITLGARPVCANTVDSIEHSFTNGNYPVAPLILGANGNFYSTTSAGGSASKGTIFEMTPTGTVTILHSFGDGTVTNDGATPEAGLLLANDGNFYGTTSAGGSAGKGAIFQMKPGGAVTIVHSFSDGSVTNDGATPYSTLIQGSDGDLYGTTAAGGSASEGTAFKTTLAGTYTLLHSFGDGTVAGDGEEPMAGLVAGAAGNYYGTTFAGGTGGRGVVYRISPNGTVKLLHTFGDGTVTNDGAAPEAPLILGADDNFYGTTIDNDTNADGTVFEITTAGVVTILHTFGDGTVTNDGKVPAAALIQGIDGNFYGTTTLGGSANKGAAFELTTTGALTILHSFGDGTVTNDGETPEASLFQYSDASFYGTTKVGTGTSTGGTVFRLAAGTTTAAHRFDFNGDGDDDLLFQNSNGQTLVWDMNGQAIKTTGATFTTVAPPWHTAAVADINADGHPDLLWWNSSTGQCLFWEMTGTLGTTVLQYEPSFASISDTHWHPVSMADFDGDGHPDILWENFSTGQLLIWYMNGNTIKKYGSAFATLPANWIIAGTADFNLDGHPDLLLENTKTGQVLVWYLTGALGTTILTYGSTFATVSDTNFSVVSTGDMNGDGHPDLTWHDKSTGATEVWLMGGSLGTTVSSYGGNIGSVPTTWSIVGVH